MDFSGTGCDHDCNHELYPMIQALVLSFKTGSGANLNWNGIANYIRMFQDKIFMQALLNNFIYLVVQVPIMLILALILASMLNNKSLKFKGFFRTAIFLPCATSLVSYAIIFAHCLQMTAL
jgi:lactose/L-arabinose transport system permease protein